MDTASELIEQIDPSLFALLDVFDDALSEKNKKFRDGLFEYLKKNIPAELDKLRVPRKELEFISEVSLPIYSGESSEFQESMGELFFEYDKDHKDKNKEFLKVIDNWMYFEIDDNLPEVIDKYINRSLIEEGEIPLIIARNYNTPENLKDSISAYNLAVKKMANLFVEHGILSLVDVGTLKDKDIDNPQVDEFNELLLQSNTEKKDVLSEHLRKAYLNIKENSSVSSWFYRNDLSDVPMDSFFGKMHDINMSVRHYLPVLKEVFESFGFELKTENGGRVRAEMSSEKFYRV